MSPEDIEKLKRSKAGFHSQLTKVKRQLNTGIDEGESLFEIIKKRENVNEAFLNFQRATYVYIEHVTQENERLEALENLKVQTEDREFLNKKVNDWLNHCQQAAMQFENEKEDNVDESKQKAELNVGVPKSEPTAFTSNSDICKIMSNIMNLPKSEIIKFDGNPLQYWTFIHNFSSNIEDEILNEKKRLNYLIQYCEGEARECIEDCVMLPSSEGYKEARKILYEQFGRTHIVAQAHLKVLTNGNPIKNYDYMGLLNLSRQMQKADITLTQMGYNSDLNSLEYLKKICKRLPYYLQGKWAERAEKIIRADAGSLKFKDLCKFVKEQSDVANNAFGQQLSETARKDNRQFVRDSQKQSQAKSASFSVQMPKFRNSLCYLCDKENHKLENCFKFKNLSQDNKFKVLKSHNLCLNCLTQGHFAKGCAKRNLCEVKDCGKRHHTLLHIYNWNKPKEHSQPQEPNAHENNEEPEPALINSMQGVPIAAGGDCVCLRIVPVKVSCLGQNKFVNTYALMDSGSSVSLCDKRLLDMVGAKGKEKCFALSTINGKNTPTKGLEVSLKVKNITEEEVIELNKVWAVDKLNISVEFMPKQKEINKWDHLKDINLPEVNCGEVLLLIGSNSPESFWVLEERRGKRGDPYAVKFPLGWTIIGPQQQKLENKGDSYFIQECTLQNLVEKFWKIDYDDSLSKGTAEMSIEDQIALKVMEESVLLKDGHYQVGMPWRKWPTDSQNNIEMAMKRLLSLKNRLKKNEDLHKRYTDVMESYLKKSYAHKVNDNHEEQNTWFIPHHPVFHPKKPEKLRIVFDCAAKYKSNSLNSMLLQGPDLTNNLIGVLLRFRQSKIAMMADIETMYYQVRVKPEDRSMLRFLWWPGGNLEKDPEIYEMLVHLFGATSSPSCAVFALRKTAEDHATQYDANVIESVYKSFYVDDFLKSADFIEEAKNIISQVRQLLSKGGFHLTKWVCNNQEVNESIPIEERSSKLQDMDLMRFQAERVLGVLWNVQRDEFYFDVSHVHAKPISRRNVLSTICSVYDPLGFIAPFLLVGKLIMQNSCRERRGWDDGLSKTDEEKWRKWLSDLTSMCDIKLRRCLQLYPSKYVTSRQLHVFGDASMSAYAAVAYLRTMYSNQDVDCIFVMGKCRLAPLKTQSVPRLELSAALLAVSLKSKILENLDIKFSDTFLWTDSTIVLQYIKCTTKRFKTFVANRLSQIRDGSSTYQWKFIKGSSNPADDATRGVQSQRWLDGPQFLHEQDESWQTDIGNIEELNDNDVELKRERLVCVVINTGMLNCIIEWHSDWFRLKKSVAWILRFRNYFVCKSKGKAFKRGPLSLKEIHEAENVIIKNVQEGLDKKHVVKLNPVVFDNLLKVGGRLCRADIKFDQKHPIILPKTHHVTDLIIKWYHEVYGHVGREHVLTLVRQRFWIVKGRVAVRRVLLKCVPCQRLNAKPCEQIMANLPPDRLEHNIPPFTNVGLDCFGPMIVTVKRSKVKRYGCIFTCLNIRAIHIEILHSLDTDSFIQALRRLISRRGSPKLIRSDCGSNFIGAQRELSESVSAWNSKQTDQFMLKNDIAWVLNSPAAPHTGGVWERMIRSVKRILFNVVNMQSMNDEMLLTIISEVESIINSRPITPNSDDPNDAEALTPNHLLLLRSNSQLPPREFTPTDQYCRKRWKQSQYLSDIFWSRWVNEYLPTLQRRNKWFHHKQNLKEGDLVMLIDEKLPRAKWVLGRILKVMKGSDGKIRSVNLKTSKNQYLTRPIQKLCKLELD